MTQELAPTIDGKPLSGEDKPRPEGIELDANGDPIRQGSLMNERQSYERVVEGLKISSDAAAHLAKIEPESTKQWMAMAKKLDQARRIAVQHAGLGLAMREKETSEVRGDPMHWKIARDRFREGLVQAAGGMRQLATCHRGDFIWSRMATDLEMLELKLRSINPSNALQNRKLDRWAARPARTAGGILLPPGYSRH